MDHDVSADAEDDLRMQLEKRLRELMIEHRDLDVAIHRLADHPVHDQLHLLRLKKRKLLLKDQISWMERQIDPDERA